MKLESAVYYKSSMEMKELGDNSVDLVVTSPPYPMIAMWDGIFSSMSKAAADALSAGDGNTAFEQMHMSLDTVWTECGRVLKPGSFACINIGDATRKLGEDFRLYPNHARIIRAMTALGFDTLPMIHWFKPTNSPTKFMGSGMLPAGAYVTLEHEYILIFRKGGKRSFPPAQQSLRRRSAFFWEERNEWFSDVWDFKGAGQSLSSGRENRAARERSGAFPFELPHRLINMYSIIGDTVLDPFLGTGTSLAAAMVNGRACVGYETDRGLKVLISDSADRAADEAAVISGGRLRRHQSFIEGYREKRGSIKYENCAYGFPVITRQEKELLLPVLKDCENTGSGTIEGPDFISVEYEKAK